MCNMNLETITISKVRFARLCSETEKTYGLVIKKIYISLLTQVCILEHVHILIIMHIEVYFYIEI
jgi:hypothetical protein